MYILDEVSNTDFKQQRNLAFEKLLTQLGRKTSGFKNINKICIIPNFLNSS